MATLHPARCHGLAELGAIAPGFHADLVAARRSRRFRAARRDRRRRGSPRATVPRCRSRRPPSPAGCATRCRSRRSPGAPRPRRRRHGARARDRDRARPAGHRRRAGAAALRDGAIVADPARDLAKLAVVERHHATGRVGAGLVRGFGLRARRVRVDGRARRAQLVVVGVDDASMAACVERLARARRRHRGRRRRRGTRRARAAGRRPALGGAGRGGRRAAGRAPRCCAEQGVGDRRAVHDALLPRALGHPRPQADRPRARRRRRRPRRSARGLAQALGQAEAVAPSGNGRRR